jgi:dolichol-phosphate mannosyltransferase
MKPILVGIPTLNEANNVERIVERLQGLSLPMDLLFIDDSSSDGTGEILNQLAARHDSLRVLHRPPFSGIGSAHQAILNYAYEHGYQTLITMDCDFSHQPEDLPRLLREPSNKALVVGSRFMDEKSLEDWNLKRRFLTHLGHWLTSRLLGLPMDATGAFRLYRLDRIPRVLWGQVRSSGYAFFFESLVFLRKGGVECAEIPIRLPKRVYGESKLDFRQALRSLGMLLRLYFFPDPAESSRNNAEGWDQYWRAGESSGRHWYAILASLYRNLFIVSRLNRILRAHFSDGALLYHVGCGSGEVDGRAARHFQIVGVDISPEARRLYQENYPSAEVRYGDIFQETLEPLASGIYSLGLVEHFSHEDIVKILKNMARSVGSKGKILIFWPSRNAPSVYFLRIVSRLRAWAGVREPLHPPEPSLLQSRAEAAAIVARAGCRILEYDFGPRDLWIQAAIVLQKNTAEI